MPSPPATMEVERINGSGVVHVLPRRRVGKVWQAGPTVTLNAQGVTSLFVMRQSDAAKFLGISLTSLKSACRQLGVTKWPYSRRRMLDGNNMDGTKKDDSKTDDEDEDSGAEEAEEMSEPITAYDSLFMEALAHVEGKKL
ncbi:hypothetical protein GUITHDRAFT_112149 [Guillardia theta CCMP2712]|uniref:RWP-RK domain-containing protein n=2 Tax=Guillardia theta TaxID=55529 RepID=L1J0S4_GUITC|nr:hypothetical protein GUITHDRAFT_112149 [Guillardia theta CCMP2712]EKX41734.1 hypothetical protein GUITHDRAFT_112149 [Guillardia theta CCMP2712]|mmetsp:Transcript_21763/g.71985  ORF Transcript_21763/g.71985 Transcript_21763/m.71985 type:complete len:140 (+) Transcript_21763:172-591(+)|eukprot:XP_005828714.1 hypothetical protein GUITHDRAFT_112149 [Guillardia theta CCMP2712]